MRLSLAAMDFADALFISDSGADTGGAHHVAIAPLAGRAAYSRFVMKDLLRHVETEHVLLIQSGWLRRNIPTPRRDDFLDHDYIGARWDFTRTRLRRQRRLFAAFTAPARSAPGPRIDRFEPRTK